MAITTEQFVKKYDGKQVTMDGNYPTDQPYQCWDLAEAFAHQVLNIPQNRWALDTGDGTAYGAWNLFPPDNPKYYVKKSVWLIRGVLRRKPPKNSLVFWNSQLPGSGGAGHVAIVLGSVRGGFISFDQNWSGKYAHRVTHNFAYVAGYLVKK